MEQKHSNIQNTENNFTTWGISKGVKPIESNENISKEILQLQYQIINNIKNLYPYIFNIYIYLLGKNFIVRQIRQIYDTFS